MSSIYHQSSLESQPAINETPDRNPRVCSCGAVSGLQGCWDHDGQWQSRYQLMAEWGFAFERMPGFIARFGYGVLEEPAVVVNGQCQRCRAKGGGA